LLNARDTVEADIPNFLAISMIVTCLKVCFIFCNRSRNRLKCINNCFFYQALFFFFSILLSSRVDDNFRCYDVPD
jgi:hypothetical protein